VTDMGSSGNWTEVRCVQVRRNGCWQVAGYNPTMVHGR